MTIEQLGSIGELIGALLVLITLIYLSLQVRTQNAIAKADGHRDLIKQLASLTRRIIDEDLSDLIVQGWLDFDSLTHVEKNRVDNFLHEYLHICEQAFYMGRDKYVPAGSYDAFMAAAASFISPRVFVRGGKDRGWVATPRISLLISKRSGTSHKCRCPGRYSPTLNTHMTICRQLV